jgi:beta-lactamase class A
MTPSNALSDIEASVGGRLGVFALDTGSGNRMAHRADERFALCSTFKWVLAAAVLSRVDRGKLTMDDQVPYGPSDLLEYAPTTRAHVAEGMMTIEALAKAAITNSDNTAANLLLTKVGGPAGLTLFIRHAGDAVTRLDRNEPTLNENVRSDLRDTTSPRAMANLIRLTLCGDLLSRGSRGQLVAWMDACETGTERLRAGIPAQWSVGDKTGTGQNGAVNDVAFVVPPGRAPILIAAYLSDSASSLAVLNSAHAEISRLAVRLFLPSGARLDAHRG